MLGTLEEAYGQYFESRLLQEIVRVGSSRELKAGSIFLEPGAFVKQIPLLLFGALKVTREYEDGSSLLLHYIEKGDAGSMLMTLCWKEQPSQVKAQAEIDTLIITIPKRNAQGWINEFHDWQRFILSNNASRMQQVVKRLENTAFGALEDNLTFYLSEKKRIHQTDILQLTHQNIAQELKSSRVVISRILKQMERKNQVRLSRNRIQLMG